MAVEVKLPPLGENIESGDVVSVLVAEGDTISEDQAILELETDKATVEVPSEVSGKVEKIHVSEGDTVKVGQVILTLAEDGGEASEEKEAAGQESAAEAGEETAEEEAGREEAAEDEAEGESEEEPEEEEEGQPEKERKEEKPSKAKKAEKKTEERDEKKADVVDFKKRQEERPAGKTVAASPAVRRFAREIGVEISQVEGSGPRGRISIEDVKAFSRRSRREGAAPGAAGVTLPDFEQWGEVEREAFSNVRRATARHVSTAWAAIPHVTNHDQADVTGLEELRERFGKRVEEAGGKLTITAIALKVAAAALEVFPKLNASLDVENQQIIYKKYCHIGVAVDTDRGLLVPVIRDVREKNITELSRELKEVAQRARDGKIGLDELKGGCFTVTNLGGIGGTSFTPIVNFPEVAILGISRTTIQPVYRDGEFRPRNIMPLSLSYDHRLVDGADAARFLRWLVAAFEEPFLMSLEG